MKLQRDSRIELFKNDDQIFLKGFYLYKHSNEGIIAPLKVTVPNIPAMYLNISDRSLKSAQNIFRKKLEPFISFNIDENYYEFSIENGDNIFFNVLEDLFISIVFTYAAVESIVNNLIPNNYFEKTTENSKEITIGKSWIEKNVKLTEKIKIYLPKIHSVKINVNDLKYWNSFKSLEYFRNELVHFKSEEYINDTLKCGPFLSKLFFEQSKNDIIESGRKVIHMLTTIIPDLQGLPHEFHEEYYDLNKNLNYFSKKR